MENVRKASAEGIFYPSDREVLNSEVKRLLFNAPLLETLNPKALIAPHAGYPCSGQIAANAYKNWMNQKDEIERIVLIGPSHFVALRNIAIPSFEVFKTPFGEVPIDNEIISTILDLPKVLINNKPHLKEYSLEVHIPFLQTLIGNFKLVPILAGGVSGDEVATVLESLWGNESTRFLVSTDLSHFHNYEKAKQIDLKTAQAIEAMNPIEISESQACGHIPLKGMLLAAKRKGLSIKRIELKNSGDTISKKDKVVGYGSWAIFSKEEYPKKNSYGDHRILIKKDGFKLLEIALKALSLSIYKRKLPKINITSFPQSLRQDCATFITITSNGNLRGCIGTVKAHQPLIADIIENTYKAANKDPRFPPITKQEVSKLEITISLLSPLKEMSFTDENDFLNQLRPKIDGLVIADQGKSALFLPQVWETYSVKDEFLMKLKQKAGLPLNHWSETMQAWHFEIVSIKSSTNSPRENKR